MFVQIIAIAIIAIQGHYGPLVLNLPCRAYQWIFVVQLSRVVNGPHHEKTCLCCMQTTQALIRLHMSDQHLCYFLYGEYDSGSCYMLDFNILASLSS